MSDLMQASLDQSTRRPDDWLMLPALPPQVWVPLGPRHLPLSVMVRPAGTCVNPDDALTDSPMQAAHRAVAPLAGRVGDLAEATLLNRQRHWAVRIDVDTSAPAKLDVTSEDSSAAGSMAHLPVSERGQWIDRLRHAGIWADRISSPDLIAQLNQSLRRPIDTIICNLLDSDRELPINESLARRWPRQLMDGMILLARIAGATRIWAVVPTGRAPTFTALASAGKSDGMRFIALPNEYPLADPTMLLYRLLNRRLRPRRLPVEQGVVLFDAACAIAAGFRAAESDFHLRDIPLAVHDHVRARSSFVRVPVGAPLPWVLNQLQCPGAEKGLIEIRGGALLREVRLDDLLLAADHSVSAAPVVIAGSELTLHVALPARTINPDPCIRCSWCVEGCPTRIHPAGLLEAAQRRDMVLAERYGIEACIECGVCSYVCPSHLPLLSGIRALRASHAHDLSSEGRSS